MPAPTPTPTWATDTNYTNGPAVGTPTKVQPSGAIQAEGHVPGTPGMAQRMNWWKNKVGEFCAWLVTPVNRTVLADFHAVWNTPSLATSFWWTPANNYRWVSQDDFAEMKAPFPRLPPGSTITGWEVRVEPGAARATSSDRMLVRLYRLDKGLSGGLTEVAVGAGVRDDGTATEQLVTHTLATPETVVEDSIYVMKVISGSDGATNADKHCWAELLYTAPGPF